MERVTGPFFGFYVAARSWPIGNEWMGVARVFKSHPSAFADPSSVAKSAGDYGNAPSELDAVENAERVAREWIANDSR